MTLRAVLDEKCTASYVSFYRFFVLAEVLFSHGVPTMFISQFGVLEKLQAGQKVEGLSLDQLDFSHLRFVSVILLHLPRRSDQACFRTGIAAGSPVPGPLMAKLIEKMNLRELTIAYGQLASSF